MRENPRSWQEFQDILHWVQGTTFMLTKDENVTEPKKKQHQNFRLKYRGKLPWALSVR